MMRASRCFSIGLARLNPGRSFSTMTGFKPLRGYKVLDLSRVLAGPYATQTLGDLGATVIKIEKPQAGDDTRKWGPPFLKNDHGQNTTESAYYLGVNRNKMSVAIDMAKPAGQRLIQELAKKCDVVVENYKVGSLEKYGLGYNQLSELNPKLVYCSISGYGQNGPRKDLAGYDFIAQGLGGLMSITGSPADEPQKIGVALVDISTGMIAASSILASLLQRDSVRTLAAASTSPLSDSSSMKMRSPSLAAADIPSEEDKKSELQQYEDDRSLSSRVQQEEKEKRMQRSLTWHLEANHDSEEGGVDDPSLLVSSSSCSTPLPSPRSASSTLSELPAEEKESSELDIFEKDLSAISEEKMQPKQKLTFGYGSGVHLDISLFDTVCSMLANQASNYLIGGIVPTRMGNSHPNIAPYDVVSAQDGQMIVAVGSDSQFADFSRVIGAPELASDSKFRTNPLRVANRRQLLEMLDPLLRAQSRDAWLKLLGKAGVPAGPINNIAQTFADPQIKHRQMILQMSNHALYSGSLSLVACPVHVGSEGMSVHDSSDCPPPVLGQHTRQVLGEELGLSEIELDQLQQEGVIQAAAL